MSVISAGDMEGGSESDMEMEPAPAPAIEDDVTSEREDEDESKESEMDISMEEPEEATPFKELNMDSPKTTPKEEEDSGVLKAEETKVNQGDAGSEVMPAIVPTTDSDSSKEVVSLPESTVAPESVSSAKDGSEHVPEPPKELPTLQDVVTVPVAEVVKESEKREESAPQLTKVKEEVPAKEESKAEAEEELKPTPPAPPAVDRQEADKVAPADDPTIPHLKKIDLDLPPSEDKKEGKEKEKLKPGKKMGRESKKSRQNEMRSSLSEIPTLEPMTTPSEVKAPRMDIPPSPYDFNDAEADSPSLWQPEITKKWEPNNKPLSTFRDVKMELKKSLETEKKKVKKKTKKAVEEVGAEGDKLPSTESPAKPCEKKVQDTSPVAVPAAEPLPDKPPLKKKGRKKKAMDVEVKMDTSSYEETVNSVVESCKSDQFVHIPLPESLECKEEKPVKKRKKTLESSAPAKDDEKDAVESGKKEPAKPGKGLKGKISRKKKEAKASDNIAEQPTDSIPLPFVSLESPIPSSTVVRRDKQPPTSQSPEPVAIKQPHLEAELPPAPSPLGACAAESSAPAPRAGPSGAHLPISMASIRPVPSTSGAAGSGPADRLAPPLECRGEVVKQAEARVDCAGDMPKAACSVGNTVLDNTPPTTPENDLDEVNSASSSSEGHDNLKEDLFSLDSGERTSKGGSESPPGCDFSLSSTSSENLPSSSSGVLSGGKPSQSSETLSSKRKRKDDSAAPVKKKRFVSRGSRGDRNKKSPKCKFMKLL